MKIARHLAEGVAAWLHYQLHCRHLWLFCERYLTEPVASVLDSDLRGRVFAEFDHPVLAPLMVGRGKRPKLDFAIINPADFPKILLAVETKWISSTPPAISDLLWDILRLELVAHHSGCEAFFLMAGKKRDLENLFTSDAFLSRSQKRAVRPLLKVDDRRSPAIRLDNPPADRIKAVGELLAGLQNTPIPIVIRCGRPYAYPKNCNLDHYQVFVWQVMSNATRPTFMPNSHKLYKTINIEQEVGKHPHERIEPKA